MKHFENEYPAPQPRELTMDERAIPATLGRAARDTVEEIAFRILREHERKRNLYAWT